MTNVIKPLITFLVFFSVIFGLSAQPVNHVWLDDLHVSSFSEGIPGVSAKNNAGGDSIKLQGVYYSRGIGLQSLSILSFFLDGKAKKFTAVVGADDRGNNITSTKF
jgi:alpha-galactosidase